ncbi:hypothetical protein EV361DRAFT_407177 [Lentinula raphanica]|nr:hypothetical protein EV361DRAFT_407177 [Lentinula raphanica]
MVSLLCLQEFRLHPRPLQDGRVGHTFLYFHPEANTPLRQHFGFRRNSNPGDGLVDAVCDIMDSEYVAPDATIHFLHHFCNEDAPTRGDGYVLIFLDTPEYTPRNSLLHQLLPPAEPVEPICESHVIAIGVHSDGTLRSVPRSENLSSLLSFFAWL